MRSPLRPLRFSGDPVASRRQSPPGLRLFTSKLLQNNSSLAMADLTREHAETALEAALDKAEDLDLKMNVAVVDAGANL